MLILTRRIGESVAIGDDIKITILDIKGKQIRLGIEAPPGVAVHREEIYQLIRELNIEAARAQRAPGLGLTKIWESLKGQQKGEE